MGQVTWRGPDAVIARVQHLAAAEGLSMNEFISRVLALATDSDEADPEAIRLRNRLRVAGLLATGSAPADEAPAEDDLARARAAAGHGTPLSEVLGTLRS